MSCIFLSFITMLITLIRTWLTRKHPILLRLRILGTRSQQSVSATCCSESTISGAGLNITMIA